MAFNKITDEDRAGKGVSGLPNTPNLTPTQLQERFDSLANLAIEKFNEFIAALESASAAGSVGSANGTVQADLTFLRQGLTSTHQQLSELDIRTDEIKNGLYMHVNTYYSVDGVPTKLTDLEKRMTAMELAGGISGDSSAENSSAFVTLVDAVKDNTSHIQDLQGRVKTAENWLTNINRELLQHVTTFTDVLVRTNLFVNDTTYIDFPYKAEIPCSGVGADYVATVVFDVQQATAGMFAPVAETGNGIVTIYANVIPDANFTIPTIHCERRCIY